MTTRLFVTQRIPGDGYKTLCDCFGTEAVALRDADTPIPRQELLDSIAGCEGVFALLTERIDDEFLDAAGDQLRIVANMAVGYDNVDVPACTKRGVIVTNTPGVLTETTADLAWTLILGAARRAGESERFLRDGKWTHWSPTLLLGLDVHDRTLGIFGMGRIGQAVARRAQGFGMRVIYHNRNRLDGKTEEALGATYVDLPTLLAESDVLSLHCPLTEDTRHAFGAAEFEAMKETAVFVNTTRGPVVDEAALAKALHGGAIFAAGLDVFEEEPKVHPDLLACDHAFLLPHVGSATQETRGKMAQIAADNLVAVLSGRAPLTCVNPEVIDN
jgi:glyoxylate reductase